MFIFQKILDKIYIIRVVFFCCFGKIKLLTKEDLSAETKQCPKFDLRLKYVAGHCSSNLCNIWDNDFWGYFALNKVHNLLWLPTYQQYYDFDTLLLWQYHLFSKFKENTLMLHKLRNWKVQFNYTQKCYNFKTDQENGLF